MEEKTSFRELQSGVWAYCVDAFVFDLENASKDKEPKAGILAILSKDLEAHAKRGDGTLVVQFDHLVKPGMILVRHVFQGLDRPLLTDGDSEADQHILVYSRKPSYDYSWGGSKTRVVQEPAPLARVFVVLVTMNKKHRDLHPDIDGWINAWSWVDEDPGLPEAPINWVDRYTRKLWTRKGS